MPRRDRPVRLPGKPGPARPLAPVRPVATVPVPAPKPPGAPAPSAVKPPGSPAPPAPKPPGMPVVAVPVDVSPVPAAPSAAALAQIVEEACRFILERKESRAKEIAWEVGEYLFERVYRGDLEYTERRDPTREDSLQDIGAGTGIHAMRLSSWMRAYVARKYLRLAGIEVELSMTNFEALRPLIHHPEAARAVLELRGRQHLTTPQLDRLAVAWARVLDEGGPLEDLVAAALPIAVAARAKRRRRHRALPNGELVPIRLLGVVLRWLRAVRLAPALRATVSRELARLRTLVVAPVGPVSSATTTTATTSGETGMPAAPLVAGGEAGAEPSAELIAEAVKFIRDRVRRHGMQFAVEVGGYLFREVYRGDRASFRSGPAPWQRETIHRIASDPRVGLSDDSLYKCIHAFLLVGQATAALPAGEVPELPLTTWNELWPLEKDPEALVAVGAWASAERVPAGSVAAVAAVVGQYLSEGGSLEDLLAGAERRAGDTPYRRVRRVLSIVEARIVRDGVSAAARERVLAALDACGEAVG